MTALDSRTSPTINLFITVFRDRQASAKEEANGSLNDLAEVIRNASAGAKDRLPWLKCARFGNVQSSKGSLRHDLNVEAITGVEADYDGEEIAVEEAIEKAKTVGLRAIIYTSPSHTPEKPRWRILCPTSGELPPGERTKLVDRVNGLYGGIFASESWTLSQSYYYGSVGNNPAHRVELIEGKPIDLLDELDAGARGKPNGAAGRTTGGDAGGPFDEAALIQAILNAEAYHSSAVRLIGKWAQSAVSLLEAQQRIEQIFNAVPEAERDARWQARYADLARCVLDIYGKEAGKNDTGGGGPKGFGDNWPEPDMGVLRLNRRPPPILPIEVFGPVWGPWIANAAQAAACPPDYVAAPLLASASALIGHARWTQATPGWAEPPHLWVGVVGDSGNGKSPGADCLMRDVLPAIEKKMLADFPNRLRVWRAADELGRAAAEKWQRDVREAQKNGKPPPLPPMATTGPEPQAPRLRQNDVTIEKVASLLATAAPKGLMIVRDELAGWVQGMGSYNPAGRAFWIEAYGGRSYSVERQKHPEPIVIPRLAVAVYGGTQPDKLALLMRDADDGLLGRTLWTWPEPIPFRLGREAPRAEWAISALDRLRELDLQPGDPPSPIMVPLTDEARAMIEIFGVEMQERQSGAGGLLRSAIGKARGQALRLALVLEYLWWCGEDGMAPPPMEISVRAFAAAAHLLGSYLIPMAERVYGDAAVLQKDRNAATLARWIVKEQPREVHVRQLQRSVRLPGLTTAQLIREAADVLIEADWLRQPASGTEFGHRGRIAYAVNPKLWEAAS